MRIPKPIDIPWKETGDSVNKAYLEARQEAFKHGGLRNKFLQSAAQAWNRNDARGAKTLSLRGQNENSLMREKHREAARVLYEERNKDNNTTRELYVDLHGLHPEEAVSYLSDCLREQRGSSRPVYAICGTGHHSKNGKDKVGKAIRVFLNEWKYAFREFSVSGDRNNVGGILGIDPTSFDKEMARSKGVVPGLGDGEDSGVGLDEGKREDTKVMVVKEDPRKVALVSE
jgi:DNA-nicking Smr family endonuclease